MCRALLTVCWHTSGLILADPTTFRRDFTRRDALPVEGGSANDYDYVSGDPVNGLDLAGTCGFPGNPFKKCGPTKEGAAISGPPGSAPFPEPESEPTGRIKDILNVTSGVLSAEAAALIVAGVSPTCPVVCAVAGGVVFTFANVTSWAKTAIECLDAGPGSACVTSLIFQGAQQYVDLLARGTAFTAPVKKVISKVGQSIVNGIGSFF